jgi:hypothetical protein
MRPSRQFQASDLRIVEPPRRRPEQQQYVQAVGDAIVQSAAPIVELGCEARNQLRVGVLRTWKAKGRVSAVAVPHTAEAIGDIGTIADCVPARVGFCIFSSGQRRASRLPATVRAASPSSEHGRGLVPGCRLVLLTDTTRPASSGFRSDHQGEMAER